MASRLSWGHLKMSKMHPNISKTLYDPRFEHDACGVGFVANTNGKREHRIVAYAIQALCNLAHRGALDADAKTGDGAGILTQLPHAFFQREVEKLGGRVMEDRDLAVGFIFTPHGNKYALSNCQRIVDEAVAQF